MDDETAEVPRGPEGVHESPRAHPIAGEFVTETLPEYDGGRQVTVYVPPHPPEAVVFAGDGQGFSKWGRFLEVTDLPSTMIIALPAERTAVFGYSTGGELALALGLRHPDVYGAVFSGSPGGGYTPPDEMQSLLPRVYLFAGTLEPFFLDNATRWAVALRDAGADVVMSERPVSHGARLWRAEFPLMVAWAFGR